MRENCNSPESLDYWRKFFSCADVDIFQVIKYAILVASSDCPDEFLACRDKITTILYTCLRTQCSSHRTELLTPEGGVDESHRSREGTPKESNDLSTSSRSECSNLDEFEALTNEIEEQQQTVGEVLRIKGVLSNWKEESEEVLSDSLRRLQLMELSVEILSETYIGRVVSGLHKHKSKQIWQLAQTLIKGWKRLADEWMTAATATQVTTPDSVNPSPSQEESLLPSELDFPPLDVGALLATQTASFEFSEIFDGMDEDGNPTSTRELKEIGRRTQKKESNLMRKDNGNIKREELKPEGIPSSSLPQRPIAKVSTFRNTQERQNHSEELRRPEIVRRAPKVQDTPVKAAANRSTEGGQKLSGASTKPTLRKDVSKESEELSYQNKLEAAKRKLHDRYEEVKNAKKQRTIQVMELKDLPKLGQNNQQHRRTNGGHFKRCVNMKSRLA